MAQLVEHIVHIDGVTGSSPVATTINLEGVRLSRFFLLSAHASFSPWQRLSHHTVSFSQLHFLTNILYFGVCGFIFDVDSLSDHLVHSIRCKRVPGVDVNDLLDSM